MGLRHKHLNNSKKEKTAETIQGKLQEKYPTNDLSKQNNMQI